MIKNTLEIFRLYFKDNTNEQFLLHKILLVVNTILFSFFILEIFSHYNNFAVPNFIHYIELFFGILFLIEIILYFYFIYIPNKIFFKPHLFLNITVIISLIFPEFFGENLALLRLIQSTKIVKIFLYKKKIRKFKKIKKTK